MHFSSGPGWVNLHRGTELVFELRAEWFGGKATIWAERRDQQIAFGVENARHAGLDLVGDTTFELWESFSGLQTAIHHHGLGLTFRGSAEQWVSNGGLRSLLQSTTTILDTNYSHVSAPPGPVTFKADGTLQFEGETVTMLHRFSKAIVSRSTRLQFRSDVTDSALRPATLELERGVEHWPIRLPRGKWAYEDAHELFDLARIEGREDRDGNRSHRIVFSSAQRPSVFRVSPDMPIRGTDGRAIDLLMKEPRYTVNLADGNDLLEAQLAQGESVRIGPLRLLLNPPKSRPALQAGDTGCCVLAEGELAGEIDNALIVPTQKPDPWNVTLLTDARPIGDYSHASLGMVGQNPVIDGPLDFRILRPQDALDICFRVTNVRLQLQGGKIESLELAHNAPEPSDFSLLIADLPPQAMIMAKTGCSSTAEGDDCSTNCTPPPVHQLPGSVALPKGRLAAPSRISMQFLSRDDLPAILGLDALLEWGRYPLNVAPAAQLAPPANGMPNAPVPDVATEIVAPAGLSVSPDENHAFFSSSAVRFDNGVSQLWTARLAKRVEPALSTSAENARTRFPVTDDRRPSLRPLVARTLAYPDDYVLSQLDLQTIITKLTNSSAQARHCVLSPTHGIWLDFGAVWPPTNDTSSFHEKIVGLLEGTVEFTYECWLVPSGHRVKIVKSGKLQWCRRADLNGVPVLAADFIERFKIVYCEPKLVSYDIIRSDSAKQRQMQCPFNSIRLIGNETAYLDACHADAFTQNCESGSPSITDYWAWISPIAGSCLPFAFPVEKVDRAGIKHQTTMQMLVACYEESYDSVKYNTTIVGAYNNPSIASDHCQNAKGGIDPILDLHGERVGYAKPTKMGDTSYPTDRMRLNAASYPDLAAAKANQTFPFYPQMASTELLLEQVTAFSDPNRAPQSSRTFEFATVYKHEPFDDISGPPSKNRAEVILSLVKDNQGKCDPAPLNFNGSLGGGLAMPSSKVVALARKTGTVLSSASDAIDDLEKVLAQIGETGMNVAGIFEGIGQAASLLGAVPLSDVLDEVADGIAQASQLPLLAVHQLQTLEQETIGKVQQALKPVLDLQDNALAFYNKWNAQVTQLASDVQLAIRTASSLVRVVATEQRPADIDALTRQTLDGNLASQASRLSSKLALSVLQRIEAATVWPPVDAEQQPVLPTLYQVRDYALNQLLATPAEALAQAFDQALESGQEQLNDDLDLASTLAGQAASDLADSLIFQFATATGDLLNALQNVDVEDAIAAYETVSDVLAAIPTLDVSGKGLLNSIQENLTQTTPPCSIDGLRQRISALSAAITQAGNQIPSSVQASLQNALQQNGTIETACHNVLQNVVDRVNDVNTLVSNFLADEETVRQQFLAIQSQVQMAIQEVRDLLTLPKQVNVNYNYQTSLHDYPPFIASFRGNRSQFSVQSSVLLNLDGSPPQFEIAAEVSNFSLNLIPSFPFALVGFDTARFESHNGGAPTVHCPFNADNVQFVGPLDFVANLASDLGLPPEMIAQIVGLGVIVGLNVQLPSVPCGAFDIEGLSIFTAIKLDFTGKPLRVVLGFANPNQHFTMTYLFLGGGGFINCEFAPSGDTAGTGMAVSGALEFGAMAALDFGVANGEVHIFGGFYMSLRPSDLLLSGYYRAGGEFDVLGLISASIEFLMSLSYENRGGQAWLSGDCEVDIDVHVLFFGESVSLHMHHDFSGRSGS
jgi:hypothetical protein